ncbi:uncharacterized protein [Chelonus insularis]|uniref:uncharacterized protein n=1 Tax=Chelonus insularis TaxID=460826 RepID=UPI00158BD0B7|nr:uncharacterized protein LOC118066714 [Chelonus insularis]
MCDNNLISFDDAKEQLDNLMKSLSKSVRQKLCSYTIRKWMSTLEDETGSLNNHSFNQNDNDSDDDILDDPMNILNSIIAEIRPKVPISGIFPSETLLLPEKGENSIDPKSADYVDAFLYSDDELDDLEEKGIAPTHYCQDCNSKNIKSISTFTHSLSKDDLFYIFDTLLPVLPGKIILDVGSRLGAVLYGAYVFTDAAKIIGVEMNNEFCQLQNEIIKKFKMEKRIKVFHKRIEDCVDIVKTADVVILNNAFEFFLPENEQAKVWNFLRQHIKKDAFIVTKPRIDVTLKNFGNEVNINIDNWVEVVDANELNEITCYRVL